jgi:hypothetical protein
MTTQTWGRICVALVIILLLVWSWELRAWF